ncbi:hypothetical protein ACIP5U_40150, partial [Streptomyces sp. NPDC088788]
MDVGELAATGCVLGGGVGVAAQLTGGGLSVGELGLDPLAQARFLLLRVGPWTAEVAALADRVAERIQPPAPTPAPAPAAPAPAAPAPAAPAAAVGAPAPVAAPAVVSVGGVRTVTVSAAMPGDGDGDRSGPVTESGGIFTGRVDGGDVSDGAGRGGPVSGTGTGTGTDTNDSGDAGDAGDLAGARSTVLDGAGSAVLGKGRAPLRAQSTFSADEVVEHSSGAAGSPVGVVGA